jgi:hypothetical protein
MFDVIDEHRYDGTADQPLGSLVLKTTGTHHPSSKTYPCHSMLLVFFGHTMFAVASKYFIGVECANSYVLMHLQPQCIEIMCCCMYE